MYMYAYMYIHACTCVRTCTYMHVQRHSLLGTIPLRENYGMTFDLWNIIALEHRVCSGASASIEKLHACTCIYVHVYVCMCSVVRRLSTEAICVRLVVAGCWTQRGITK